MAPPGRVRLRGDLPGHHRPHSDALGTSRGAARSYARKGGNMNQIIYLVGLIVIVIAILSFFGLS
ncbi:hypothetical protein LCM4579_13905 [Ensifer sp. LCM 4579]|nr:hypothetical protein LCM4579_13905 [Ensifer sp. LCM 4579]